MWGQALAQGAPGVQIPYRLPTSGAPPQTYLVTRAIVRKDNPRWIISPFVRGEPRTVTAENKGAFSDAWDGLDENLMPVPPGAYAVKGIYMPARQWTVDGEYHAVSGSIKAANSSCRRRVSGLLSRDRFTTMLFIKVSRRGHRVHRLSKEKPPALLCPRLSGPLSPGERP